MSDHMKEAERLAQAYADAVLLGEGNDEALAALLAHIQRGAVLEGWKEATIAWEVCASIHREYAKKKDPFFTTRQADFVKHTEAARSALLAAAPAPDQFRDATKMMAEPAHDRIAAAIHYPECWDTAAYPTVESALAEMFAHYHCTEHAAPAEVPMPEQIGFIDSDDDETWATLTQNAHELATLKLRSAVFHVSQMRTYGAACRAVGEAAGYARGLKEAGRDVECDLPPRGWRCTRGKGHSGPCAAVECPEEIEIVERAMARLRGEVKP